MLSKKRRFTEFSVDDSGDEFGSNFLTEEQTTFDSNRSSKKVFLSTSTSSCYHNKNLQSEAKVSTAAKQALHAPPSNDLFAIISTSEVGLDNPFDSEHHSDSDSDLESNVELEEGGDCESISDDRREEGSEQNRKRQRYKSLDGFRELRTEFIQQFMRMLCPKVLTGICTVCGKTGPSLTCIDCFHFRILCQECILEEHNLRPLHRVQYFDGCCWQRTTLLELGLIVRLGHDGNECPASRSDGAFEEVKRITVIDIKGIQEVNVLFCNCDQSFGLNGLERSQFICHGWYPATTENPRTVATFNTLDFFEVLSGEAKMSGYHFYKSLVRLRDGPGVENVPKRYEEFMRMTREYQHIKQIQRAGKMCNPNIPLTLNDGDLAVVCPACPHPGKNLPEDWDKQVETWIYTLFIMIDANFRLKSKRKRSKNDLDLGGGDSYFVRDIPYKEYLKGAVDEKEIKCCDSGLRAVDHANLKGGKKYNASGVVGVQCRHMLYRSNGVGNLQKGEKYANVDYIVLSSLKGVETSRIIMSYDIACQYSRNFTKRMQNFDESMQLDLTKTSLEFVIPQFHITGHGDSCRTRYNLRYREHVGRTDGENIERGWAGLNPLSMASKEMGPGARCDYLDWHIGDWSYQRLILFGSLFSKKLKEAIIESVKHTNAMMEFRKAFSKILIKNIEDGINKWNKNPYDNPDPYAEHMHGTNTYKVRRMLAELEANEVGAGSPRPEDVSVVHWLVIGLELEDDQQAAKKSFKILKKEKNTGVNTVVFEKNISTLRKLRAWKSQQLLHMPRLSGYELWDQVPDGDSRSIRSWDIGLNLPSSIRLADRDYVCPASLVDKEYELRVAQALDSLEEVRRLVQREWWMSTKKRKHVSGPGQKNNTKSILAIEAMRERREIQVGRYRRAREALTFLRPGGSWQTYLRVLRDEDIRPMEDDEGKGEGRRSPSWIWVVVSDASRGKGDNDVHEGLKIEYAKSRARAKRWLEEVQLLREEMRRVLSYFNWRIGWWHEQLSPITNSSDSTCSGCVIYGNRQIHILRQLGEKFRREWIIRCGIEDLPEVRTDGTIVIAKIEHLPILINSKTEA